MIGALLHYSGFHCDVGIDLGGLQYVNPRTGLDHCPLVEVGFAHGHLSMSSATLRELMDRGDKALTAQRRERRA